MADIDNLLNGEACPSGPVHFREKGCDEENFVPVVKYNMGYIVGAVIFNEDNTHILLVQEAKAKCRGLWYYPVGRLEPKETLIEGAKREVKEEAGVDITPTKLLCVETTSGSWFRFTFTGPISGELKSKPDEESLQASWAPIDEVLQGNSARFPLRHDDFLPLIIQKQQEVHCSLLPALVPHAGLLMRLLFVTQHQGEYYYVVNGGRLPVLQMQPFKLILWPIHRFCETVFDDTVAFKTAGVLGIEHSASKPGKTDGMCLSLLIQYSTNIPPHPTSRTFCAESADSNPGPSRFNPSSGNLLEIHNKDYSWQKVEASDLKHRIADKLEQKNTVPLLVLRW